MSNVLMSRSVVGEPPVAVSGESCWLVDTDERRYLDGADGAAASALTRNPRQRSLEMLAPSGRLTDRFEAVSSSSFRPSPRTNLQF